MGLGQAVSQLCRWLKAVAKLLPHTLRSPLTALSVFAGQVLPGKLPTSKPKCLKDATHTTSVSVSVSVPVSAVCTQLRLI